MQVRGVLRRGGCRPLGFGPGRDGFRRGGIDDRAPVRRDPRRSAVPRHQHGGTRVLEHEGHALGRGAGLHGQVGPARLQHREDRHHHLDAGLQG